MVAIAKFDELRSLAFGDISGSYTAVGSPLSVYGRIITITNNTEGDMLFTTDENRDEIFVAAGSFKLYDIQANINLNDDDRYVIPKNTQFYVKQITAPNSGAVYIEIVH